MLTESEHLDVEALLAAVEETTLSATARDHLMSCSRCREEVASLKQVRGQISSPPHIELSDLLMARIMKDHSNAMKNGTSPLLRLLTWKLPLYQAAGLALLCALLWNVVAPVLRSESRPYLSAPPPFIVATGESLSGP